MIVYCTAMMRFKLVNVVHILPVNDKCVQLNRYRPAMFCEKHTDHKLFPIKEHEKVTPTRKVYM
jgi:hypothetical protein